jgi:hypothetical protein
VIKLKPLTLALLCAGLLNSVAPAALAQTVEAIVFAAEAKSETVDGSITGQDYADYVVSGTAGQVLSVTLSSENASVNFNVLPPGDIEALFIGSIYGPEFAGRLPVDGDYTIRVYQMGAAASDGQSNGFSLDVGMDAVTLPEQEDAVVVGTDYNATGTLTCSFEASPDWPACDFGVQRQDGGAASVFVTTPSGFVRQLDFDGAGAVTAPGSDAGLEVTVEGDETVVNLNSGEEVYRVPDAVISGG